MERLSHILPEVLRKRGFQDSALVALRMGIAQRWLEQEFPQSAGLVTPFRLEHGILDIGTADEHILSECESRSHELLAFMKKESPGPGIESVRFLRG